MDKTKYYAELLSSNKKYSKRLLEIFPFTDL